MLEDQNENNGLTIPVRKGLRINKQLVNKRSKAIQKKVAFADQTQKGTKVIRSSQVSHGHETKIKRHTAKKEHDFIFRKTFKTKKSRILFFANFKKLKKNKDFLFFVNFKC